MNMKIYNNTTDAEIIEYTRNQNKEYYGYIVDRYESKLLAYVKRLTYNSPEAEDLVQQALVNAYINLNSFEIDNKFSSWIYRIAHNLAINWLKKKKAHISLDQDEVTANKIRDKIDIEKEIINKETGKSIMEAINNLPDKHKKPFILKYFEEKSYEEISYILKISKNTVGTFISRAKKFLQKELEKKHVQKTQK